MYEYRIGGSLRADDPTYIERSADNALYDALLRGEFCSVLASRQMGKSSLRLRTRHRLETSGCGRCAAIDMTRIGSQNLSPDQWYLGFAYELQRKLGLQRQVMMQQWWHQLGSLPPVQKLSLWIEEILVVHCPDEPLFVFLDEIDSVRGLRFSVEDFFGLVRFCYNERAENPIYRHLTWALFGVATPRSLAATGRQTPFNLGRSLHLSGFSFAEAAPLAHGLSGIAQRPDQVLAEVLHWTGGQPFLTQKLCGLLRDAHAENQIVLGQESACVADMVRSHVIEQWEAQDEPEHLRTIRDRLLADPHRSGRLLGIYQQILVEHSIEIDNSEEQAELRLSGLVTEQNNGLNVANPIYAAIFDTVWVNQCLSRQRPYAAALECWAASDCQDESRLLMGNALREALQWASDKRLSDLDYRFLSASQAWDAKMVRMELDAQERVNRMLEEAQKKASQSIWLGYLSLGACLAISLIALVASVVRG